MNEKEPTEECWRVSYATHGPYSAPMTKENASRECREAGGEYIVDTRPGADPKIIPVRFL